MSTCPENDIHSVFVDGELPEIYKKKYLAHVDSCAECKREARAMQRVHELLSADSASIEMTRDELDRSFERLKAKLSYSSTVSRSKNVLSFPSLAKYAVGAAAAAAVLAFALPGALPVRGAGRAAPSVISAIRRPLNNTLAAFGHEEHVSAGEGLPSLFNAGAGARTVDFIPQNNSIVDQKIIQGTPVDYTTTDANGQPMIISTINSVQTDLAAIDVFRPDFGRQPITITVSLSGLAPNLNNAEIRLQAAPQ